MFGDPLGLMNVARKAVENDVLASFSNFLNFVVHEFDDFFVGNEFAFF